MALNWVFVGLDYSWVPPQHTSPVSQTRSDHCPITLLYNSGGLPPRKLLHMKWRHICIVARLQRGRSIATRSRLNAGRTEMSRWDGNMIRTLSSSRSSYKKRHAGTTSSNQALIPACDQSELRRIDRRKWSCGVGVLQKVHGQFRYWSVSEWQRATHHAIDPIMKFLRGGVLQLAWPQSSRTTLARRAVFIRSEKPTTTSVPVLVAAPLLVALLTQVQEKGQMARHTAPIAPHGA